jgi:hypothetical protein
VSPRLRRLYIVKILSLISGLGFVLPAAAAVNASPSLTMSAPKSRIIKEKAYFGAVALNYSQSLIDHQDGQKRSYNSGMLSAGGRVLPAWVLSGRLGFQQDLKDGENKSNGVTDLGIAFKNRRRELTDWLDGQWTLTASYPLSETSTKVQEFKGALGTRYQFSLSDEVLARGLDLSLTLGGSRSFHQFDTDKSGRTLTQYSIREGFDAGYGYRRWSFSLSFLHIHQISYQSNVSQAFEHTEEIGYMIMPRTWKIAAGHTNSGSWLKANETDSNLELFNENDSMAYFQTEVFF